MQTLIFVLKKQSAGDKKLTIFEGIDKFIGNGEEIVRLSHTNVVDYGAISGLSGITVGRLIKD